MKIKIQIYESPNMQIGKMSRKTYENLPGSKRLILTKENTFYIGDLIRPIITIEVIDGDNNLDIDTLYLHEDAKKIYYPQKSEIEV